MTVCVPMSQLTVTGYTLLASVIGVAYATMGVDVSTLLVPTEWVSQVLG